MQEAGADIVKHYRDLAFMGFIEIVRNLPTILQNLKFCKRDISRFQPDAIIFIDYPGFNLRIVKWAKQQGYKTIYYISPQVWAWKENRVKLIKQCIDKMLVILPFEKEFYKKWGYEVDYVGHPLVEVINDFTSSPTAFPLPFAQDRLLTPKGSGASNLIALLPGSRKQEILKKLPIMLNMCRFFPEYAFVVAKAPGLEDAFYAHLLEGFPNVFSVRGQTYNVLMHAKAACVTSGTATLETALFGVPEVVCYKGSAISYQIAKRLIKVKFISLVNLIMDKEVVKELIQDDLTAEHLKSALENLLNNQEQTELLEKEYTYLKKLLSEGGHASANAAKIIVDFLSAP